MTRTHTSRIVLLALIGMLALPLAAMAQSQLTGEVTDNTAGVLPGVTVEAASPVLIEGSRLAFTDGSGRYTIVDLRPGTYTVTFTLPGFSTLIREEVEVPANFTQTIDAVMTVGGLEETVTVSGESPVVDVQSAARTEVLARDTIDSLPTPRNTQSIGYLAQGVRLSRPDVGGAAMMEQTQMLSHGANSAHTEMQVDGMKVNSQMGDGRIMNYNNQALSQEMTVGTSGSPPEVQAGGARLNMIPKDGGNNVSGSLYYGYSDGGWQANNLDDNLRGQGLTSVDGISNIYDFNPALGGPILRDKLWYFGSARGISVDETRNNVELPDGSQAVMEQYVWSGLARLTYQINPRNKFSTYFDRMFKFKGREFSFGVEPTQASSRRDPDRANYHTYQAKWTSTLSNRMLLEVGYSQVYERLLLGYQPDIPISDGGAGRQIEQPVPSDLRTCVVTPCFWDASTYPQNGPWYDLVTTFDDVTRQRTVAYDSGNLYISPSDRFYPNAALSYVTGTHNIKFGVQWSFGNDGQSRSENGHIERILQDGVPQFVDVRNSPAVFNSYTSRDLGIYAQDSWTVDRLTLNYGFRWDSFASRNNLYDAGDSLPGGRFVTARAFPEVDAKPFWNDIAPRFSVVYDLFGDARTAAKFSVNRFVQPYASGFARAYHPIRNVQDRRDWFDCALSPAIHGGAAAACSNDPAYAAFDGDGIPQDWEIGLRNNTAIFNEEGGIPPAGARAAEDLERPWNLEWSASLQHEVAPRVSVTGAWYRRVFYDIFGRRNLAIPDNAYLPFMVTSPAMTLRDGSTIAPQTFTAFDLDPAFRGLTDNVDVTSDINQNFYNGFELSINARLPNGGSVFGGWTAHQHIQDTCDLENPNGQSTAELIDLNRSSIQGGRFCDQSAIGMPIRHDFKLFGSYPLPLDIEFSGSIQSYAGNQREGQWIIPSSLFPGGSSVFSSSQRTVQLLEPGSQYFERWNQVDIAIRKIFRFGSYQSSVQADIYNLFNGNAILSDNDTVGSGVVQSSSFQTPTTILQGRLVRLAFQTSW